MEVIRTSFHVLNNWRSQSSFQIGHSAAGKRKLYEMKRSANFLISREAMKKDRSALHLEGMKRRAFVPTAETE